MSAQSTALATQTQGTPGLMRTPDEFQSQLSTWRSAHAHVLSPVATFSGIPPHFGLMAARVEINPDPNGGEVYQDPLFCKGDEVAIAKPGLSKIAQAAGLSIKTERTDPRTIPNYWEVRATVRFVGLDGTVQEYDATAEYDLRDSSPRVRNFGDKQRQAARSHGLRGCEARAINAAIRQLGIRQKYHKADLLKPFMCVRVVHNPDMTDEATRRIVTERAMGGASALYPHAGGGPAQHLDTLGVGPDVIDAEPVRTVVESPARGVVKVTSDMEAGTFEVTLEGGENLTTTSAEVGNAAMAAKKAGQKVRPTVDAQGMLTAIAIADGAPASAAPVDEQLRISAVDKKTGQGPKGPWLRYDVTLSNGSKCSTFDKDKHAAIDEALAKKLPVKVQTSENGNYDDKLDAIEIVDSRQARLY